MNRVLANTVSLSAAQIVTRFANFFLVLYMTRYFGTAMYGTYLTIGSLQLIFSVIGDFGFSNLIIRDIARNKTLTKEYVSSCLLLRLLFSLVAFSGLILTGYLLQYPSNFIFLLFLSGLSIPFASLTGVFASVLAGYEKMHISSAWDVAARSAATVANVLLLISGFGLKGIFVSNLIVSVIALFSLMHFMSRRELKDMKLLHFTDIRGELGKIVKASTPFFVAAVLGVLYIRTEIVLISKFSGVSEVGWFGAGLKPLEVAFIIPVSIFTAFYPRISIFFSTRSREKIMAYYEKTLRFMVTIGAPLAVIFFTFSDRLVLLLYGQELPQAAQAMSLLSWLLFFSFVSSPVANLIFASDHTFAAMRYLILGSVIRLALSIYFIYKYGYLGGCFSLLAGEIIYFFINYYLIKKFNLVNINALFYIRILSLPILGASVMFLYLKWVNFMGLPVLLTTSIFVYGLFMVATRALGHSMKFVAR